MVSQQPIDAEGISEEALHEMSESNLKDAIAAVVREHKAGTMEHRDHRSHSDSQE